MKFWWKSSAVLIVLLLLCWQNMFLLTRLGKTRGNISNIRHFTKFSLGHLGTSVFHGQDNLEVEASSLYDLSANDIQGNEVKFEQFKGRVRIDTTKQI